LDYIRRNIDMTECMYCEIAIHGGCLKGECTCECKGDRNKFIKEQLSGKMEDGSKTTPAFST
jgi:hypothetical protein